MDLVPCQKHIYNVIKNDFNGFSEIIFYKKPFVVETGNVKFFDTETGEIVVKGQDVDRSRKFEIVDGVLRQKDGCNLSLEYIQNSIKNSRNRAIDNLFGYVLSNEWKYFVTLTFSPEFVNRSIDDQIKEKYTLFREQLTYYFPDVTYFCIPERHPRSNCLHFHILIGNCCLNKYITKAINPKTNKYIYQNGHLVYNLNLFKFGFSTLVKTYGDPLKVANYIAKYVIKDFGNIGYNKKSFYHSRNLNFKKKEFFLSLENSNYEDTIKTMINDDNFSTLYKENDKMVVYRVKLPFDK